MCEDPLFVHSAHSLIWLRICSFTCSRSRAIREMQLAKAQNMVISSTPMMMMTMMLVKPILDMCAVRSPSFADSVSRSLFLPFYAKLFLPFFLKPFLFMHHVSVLFFSLTHSFAQSFVCLFFLSHYFYSFPLSFFFFSSI